MNACIRSLSKCCLLEEQREEDFLAGGDYTVYCGNLGLANCQQENLKEESNHFLGEGSQKMRKRKYLSVEEIVERYIVEWIFGSRRAVLRIIEKLGKEIEGER